MVQTGLAINFAQISRFTSHQSTSSVAEDHLPLFVHSLLTTMFGGPSSNMGPFARGLQLDGDLQANADARDARMAEAGYDREGAALQDLALAGAAGQFGGHPYAEVANPRRAEGGAVALHGDYGADKLEPRLFAMLSNAGCKKSTMDALGNAEATSVSIFHALADDKASFRSLVFRITELDSTVIANSCEVAKVVACWASSEIACVVEAKAVAERAVRGLPPPILEGEYSDFVEQFGKREYVLTKAQVPSEAYFERKLHEAGGRFGTERLTNVTNMCQVDMNNDVRLGWNQVSGTFEQKARAFGVPLPRNPEALRARLEVMAVVHELVKYKLPQKAQLRSQTLTLWDRYIRWLFGADVWGMHSKDDKGRARSTPSITHVIGYDYVIREKVAKLMNRSVDIAMAFRIATSDLEIKWTGFSQPYSLDAGKAECLACSAPGFSEAHSTATSSGGNAPAAEREHDNEPGMSKSAKKKAKAAASRQVLNDKLKVAQAAAANRAPPVGQGPGSSRAQKRQERAQAKGAGKGAAKGAGKGAKADGDGKIAACFDHNKADGCKRTACRFAHVCQICGGGDHVKLSCPQK